MAARLATLAQVWRSEGLFDTGVYHYVFLMFEFLEDKSVAWRR